MSEEATCDRVGYRWIRCPNCGDEHVWQQGRAAGLAKMCRERLAEQRRPEQLPLFEAEAA